MPASELFNIVFPDIVEFNDSVAYIPNLELFDIGSLLNIDNPSVSSMYIPYKLLNIELFIIFE